MTPSRDGTPEHGAHFVNEYGMGPAERRLVRPNYVGLGYDASEATNSLADVVALAELLLEELASVTGVHERIILDRIEAGDTTFGVVD